VLVLGRCRRLVLVLLRLLVLLALAAPHHLASCVHAGYLHRYSDTQTNNLEDKCEKRPMLRCTSKTFTLLCRI
jgi:hypothetical protein